MSKSLNKVQVIGNVGKDPEIRYMPSGGAVVNFSLATSEFWKDKVTGEKKEKTEWHKIVFFNKQADIIGEHVKKGNKLYIEGKLSTRKWQNKEGQDQYTTEIVGNEFIFLPTGTTTGNAPGGAKPAMTQEEEDDDIPF